MSGNHHIRIVSRAIATAVLCVLAQRHANAADLAPRRAAVVYVSDGMRHDLMRSFALGGYMPTFGLSMLFGTTTHDGMFPAVPPNSAVGWSTLLTGASAARSGITNNLYHDNTQDFAAWEPSGDGFDPANRLSQSLIEAAEAAGHTTAVLNWVGFAPYYSDPSTQGPVLDYYPDWLTGRGVVSNYALPDLDVSALSPPWLTFDQVTLSPAAGWTNAPTTYSPAQQWSFDVGSLAFEALVYDSLDDGRPAYDHVLISPSKDAATAVAVLEAGEWSSSIDATVDTWSGPERGGFYFKLIDLTPDLSKMRLYFTPVVRPRAWPAALEQAIVDNFDAFTPEDYGPYLANLIDAQTYVEQHLRWYELVGESVIPYILDQYRPELALIGNTGIDAIQHRFLGRAIPGSPNYDPVNGPKFWRYIRQFYTKADEVLGVIRLHEPLADVVAVSDHGFSVSAFAVNAEQVLIDQGLSTGIPETSRARAFGRGGTAQIYLSLQGRNPSGLVPVAEYEQVRAQIVAAFEALGPEVVERVLVMEEADAVELADGVVADMLHPTRTGDVIVFAAPPYQFDAPTAGVVIAPAPIHGQHGFLPDGSPDRFATFLASGPHIRCRADVSPVVATDIAPTIASLLNFPPPAQSEGRVLPMLR